MEASMAAESSRPLPQQLAKLVQALEHTVQMAKQLRTTTDLSHRLHIFTSRNSAHQFSSFLSHHHHPPAAIVISNALPPEDSVSSAEQMQVVDCSRGDVQNLKNSVDRTEEKVRDFYIQ